MNRAGDCSRPQRLRELFALPLGIAAEPLSPGAPVLPMRVALLAWEQILITDRQVTQAPALVRGQCYDCCTTDGVEAADHSEIGIAEFDPGVEGRGPVGPNPDRPT